MKGLGIMMVTVVLFGCTSHPGKQPSIVGADKAKFHTPVIIFPKSKDPMQYSTRDIMEGTYFQYAGKFKFADTIKLVSKRDSEMRLDMISEPRNKQTDTMAVDGLQMVVDYETDIQYCDGKDSFSSLIVTYPVFLINETNKDKYLQFKDGYLYGLQEGKNEQAAWRPIEHRGMDWCGNGRMAVRIHPGEFVVFLVPKYAGNYETQMRVRMKNGNMVYVSPTFTGCFNPKLFRMTKKDFFLEMYREHPVESIVEDFYGTIPEDLATRTYND